MRLYRMKSLFSKIIMITFCSILVFFPMSPIVAETLQPPKPGLDKADEDDRIRPGSGNGSNPGRPGHILDWDEVRGNGSGPSTEGGGSFGPIPGDGNGPGPGPSTGGGDSFNPIPGDGNGPGPGPSTGGGGSFNPIPGDGNGPGPGPSTGGGGSFDPSLGDGNGSKPGPSTGDGGSFDPSPGDGNGSKPGSNSGGGGSFGPGLGDGNGSHPSSGGGGSFGPGLGDGNGSHPSLGGGGSFGPDLGDGNGSHPSSGSGGSFGPGLGDGNGYFGLGSGMDSVIKGGAFVYLSNQLLNNYLKQLAGKGFDTLANEYYGASNSDEGGLASKVVNTTTSVLGNFNTLAGFMEVDQLDLGKSITLGKSIYSLPLSALTPWLGTGYAMAIDFTDIATEAVTTSIDWNNWTKDSKINRIGNNSLFGKGKNIATKIWESGKGGNLLIDAKGKISGAWNAASNFTRGAGILSAVSAVSNIGESVHHFRSGNSLDGWASGIGAAGDILTGASLFTGPAAPFVAGAGVLLMGVSAGIRYREQLGKAWKSTKKFVGDTWKATTKVASETGKRIGSAVSNTVDSVGKSIKSIGKGIGSLFS